VKLISNWKFLQTMKRMVNTIMDHFVPSLYMAKGITIHLYSTIPLSTTLNNLCTLKSLLLWCTFRVDASIFADKDETIGFESTGIKGRFVGISEHVGHLLINKSLKNNTLRLFHALTSILKLIPVCPIWIQIVLLISKLRHCIVIHSQQRILWRKDMSEYE